MSDKEPIVEEPTLPTPGQILKEARIGKGLSVEQVANKINLRAHNIEAIEQDKDDGNLSVTFTRGYLKLYAKFVDVNEDEVLQAFERINSATKEPAKLQSFSRRVAKQTSDARLMMLTYAIIGIVIALSVVWWLQQSNDSSVSQLSTSFTTQTAQVSNTPANTAQNSQPEVQQAPTSSAQADLTDTQLDDSINLTESDNVFSEETSAALTQVAETVDRLNEGDNGVLEQELEAPVSDITDNAQTTTNNAESEVVQIENTAGTTESFGPPVELIFEFSEDCWMNLVDATGEAIAYGVKVAGRVMTVSGVPPFEVTLGAPQAVQISMAGEPIDMSRFPAGRTARFELPIQE
ncbi:DUF4115 domain-containing protein [Alteromonadaceae bacterium M269]|nr:DUF4115 domain-containing protein [Alteromonadaceae bacterium M269]